MIQTSTKWKEYSRDIGTFHIKATINNGTSMTLTDADFMQGTVSITDSVSGMDDFTVGAVITNSFIGTLNNFDGKFNNYTLGGARLSVQFGIVYEDSTEEWIDRGIYTLEKPTSLGSTIKVTGYDDMDKLNRYYVGQYTADGSVVNVTFPVDASTFAERLCNYCGVQFGGWELDSANIRAFEYNESTTCRQVLGWLVQSFGGYARVNNTGEIECKAFSFGEWTSSDDLDGGVISPWSSIDSADGGTIQPWSAVTDYKGGRTSGDGFILSKIKTLDVYIEDITITGVRAFAYNTVDEFEFDTVGTNGYILAIQDNPLVTDNTLAVATRVNNAVSGLTFRPFNASIFGDPSIEAGDVIVLKDYLDNEHSSIITSLAYAVNQAEQLECNAKSPEEADLATANPTTSIIAGATMASYDYVIAKKISADYISAGTIEASIVAKDLTMDGGSVNLTTNSATADIISLTYGDDVATMRGGHFEIRTGGSDTIRGELGVSSTNYAAVKIYNASGTCISTIGETSAGGGVQCNNSSGNVRCVLSTSSNGTGSLNLYNTSNARTVAIDAYSPAMQLFNSSGTSYTISLNGSNGAVFAASYNNTSSIDLKKNIKKAESMLSKIVDADILSFNYKGESKDTKSHIGLAIGGEYNVPEEVIAESDDGEQSGVDLYTMVSMAWKAIQEQQAEIETLKNEVADLKEKVNGNTDQKR